MKNRIEKDIEKERSYFVCYNIKLVYVNNLVFKESYLYYPVLVLARQDK